MMKTLNKLAAIALLIGTGQTFAGGNLSANLHTAEPSSLQASAMEIMSVDELSAVKGGTFFAPLTPNQVATAIAGFAANAAGGANYLNIILGVNPNSELGYLIGDTDVVNCGTLNRLNGTTLATSQISAGNYAGHRLSAADVGLSFGLGVGVPFMSIGCVNSKYAVHNQVMLSWFSAQAIIDRKHLKISQTKTHRELVLLHRTWNQEDGWFKWGVTQAEAERDNIVQTMAARSLYWSELPSKNFGTVDKPIYNNCGTINAPVYNDMSTCSLVRNDDVILLHNIAIHTYNFKRYATEAGKAAAQHAKTIGLKYEAIKIENPSYTIGKQ